MTNEAISRESGKGSRQRSVVGSGGVHLHVREFGPEEGPAILFVHGWAQCHLTWRFQTDSALADRFHLVAFDMRGHGMSEVSLDGESYTSGKVLAEDVAAVIDQCGLVKPIIVGWSHGSFVVCDYLRHYGDERVSGVVLMSWAVRIGADPELRQYIGPGFEDFFEGTTSHDLPTNIDSTRSFVDAMVTRPLDPAVRDQVLAYNVLVRPDVRLWTASHEDVDNMPILAGLSVPLLAIHGSEDLVVLQGSLNLIREAAPDTEIHEYVGVGHAPQLEDPDRLNGDIVAFADLVFQDKG